MAVKYPKQSPMPLSAQMYSLKATYSSIDGCGIKNGVLTCLLKITPSETSDTYKLRIKYKLSLKTGEYYPQVWLLDPPMQKKDGDYPKHIYASRQDAAGHQCLCVFYPGFSEWNRQMMLSRSFVPWISTWLNTYEYWLITDEWHYPESPHAGAK